MPDTGEVGLEDTSDSESEGSKSDLEERFTEEEVETFERSSEAASLNFGFFLLALLYMWPYHTLLQTQTFLSAKFPDRAVNAGNTMMLATTWPFMVTHGLLTLTGLSRRLTYTCKLVVPGVLISIIALGLILVMSYVSSAEFLLNSLYCAALLCSIAEGMIEPAVYDMAGLYPSALTTKNVMFGNGATGVVVCIVKISVRLCTNGVKPLAVAELEQLTHVYFALMGLAGIGLPAVYLLLMRRSKSFKKYVKCEYTIPKTDLQSNGSDGEASATDPGGDCVRKESGLSAALQALKHVWPSMVATTITYITSLALWPVIPGSMCLSGPGDSNPTLRSWWFDIVLLIFNVGDLVGKSEHRSLSWGARNLSSNLLLACALCRAFLMFPLVLTASAPQSYSPTVASWVALAGVLLLGVSNGWLSTVCFMRAPKALPAGTSNSVAEQASTLMVMGLFAGISLGSLAAYELGEGPLQRYIGACHAGGG
ncbi:unnamed protein product [Polarella glacialis]|uniref:Battenin n=1 Tax=Polarella glacialis TaxID=89957 RepID=A0A813JE09_POLGL|nr:unnamed protein product [Polarella glacialis]